MGGDVGLLRVFVEAALFKVTCIALLKEVMWYVNEKISPSAPFARCQQVASYRSDCGRGDGAAGRTFLYSGWALLRPNHRLVVAHLLPPSFPTRRIGQTKRK